MEMKSILIAVNAKPLTAESGCGRGRHFDKGITLIGRGRHFDTKTIFLGRGGHSDVKFTLIL
jgi:hypothetical protein